MEDRSKKINVNHYADGTASVLRKKVVFTELRFYQRSEVLYHLTKTFCQRFLPERGDRTVDQMVQAARSAKQNIAEGVAASTTSAETELKLLNVAKASLQELLEDFKDYLRVRELDLWDVNSEKHRKARKVCRNHNDSEFYVEAAKIRSAETIANIAIIIIHQTDYLIREYFDNRKKI